LFNRCWGSSYVGDDSLNRAVGALRRAIEAVGGTFQIETIPRTGYRLTGVNVTSLAQLAGAPNSAARSGSSRRSLIAGSAAAAVLAIAGTIWWSASTDDRRFQQLIDEAQGAMRREEPGEKIVQILRQALAIRPSSARAWGLLALVRCFLAQDADAAQASHAVDVAESTARRALALDPQESNALLAMFELEGASLDWITRDHHLRQIINIDPKNVLAIQELMLLTGAAGLIGESLSWNERELAIEPLSVVGLGTRALKLWVAGRIPAADKVIDQVRGLYPKHPWAWWVRFFIFAMTGRPQAAQSMLAAEPQMTRSAVRARLWQDCLPALERASPAAIAKARTACLLAARGTGFMATEAAVIMCALGEVDIAYDIADAVLFSRGPIVRPAQRSTGSVREDAGWRINTQWMWTPPCAVMRADRRFRELCEGVGLTDYWSKRGVRPDYLRSA
jgi:tetratricopeptide (TPR) repeat protein